eukprot:TRINITY_DN26045_c0_g2_i2.p1 TRINITY_DN26045_c0_g2~~TRINITY_DN26045_c0_g2_i2.p1  ORF type:complete len:658 (-),score=112.66 TRINITY_DN26045_c0_g2_i2:80-2053(-)
MLADIIYWRRSGRGPDSTWAAATLVVAAAALAFGRQALVDAARWHLGYDGRPSPGVPLRRRLKVAILGGGIGGSAVALWLRDALGDVHDLDLTVICDGPIGGRCQTAELQGLRFEVGCGIVPGMAWYFRSLMRRFKIKRRAGSGFHLPRCIFDGSDFLLCSLSSAAMGGSHTLARLFTALKLAQRFGFGACWRLWLLTSASWMLDWRSLRRALHNGATFGHPREMLSILGPWTLRLPSRSAKHWLLREVGLPRELVSKVVEPALRNGYGGQGCDDLNALAGLLGISSGGVNDNGFAVLGGVGEVPRYAFEAAQPRHICGSARVVRRVTASKPHEPMFEVAYDANGLGEAMKGSGSSSPSSRSRGKPAHSDVEGLLVEAFHLVVVAHPLERSSLRFEACCGVPFGGGEGNPGACGEASTLGSGGGGCGGSVAASGFNVHGDATAATQVFASSADTALPSLIRFRRCVVHLVRGTLDIRRFSKDAVEADAEGAADVAAVRFARRVARGKSVEADGRLVEVPCYIPAKVLTTADSTAPFYSVDLQLPVDLDSSTAARKLLESAERGEPQVYRVLAPRPLSDAEIDTWFLRRGAEPVQIVDWYACPQYSAPQAFRPFVLDSNGVYYVNAIEEVSSSVEMSLISARNVVNLVLDWVNRSLCF